MKSPRPSAAGRTGRGMWTWAITAGLAGWWLVTGASHHPLQAFDRLRGVDPTGALVPNWRFFAPEPAQHDFHILHRVLTADGEQTSWRETSRITPRGWTQMIWFPGRRREKAVFDVCAELLAARGPAGRDVSDTPAYRLVRDFVEYTVRQEYAGRDLPRGFQFVIARHTGYEQDPDPDYLLASPMVLIQKDE